MDPLGGEELRSVATGLLAGGLTGGIWATMRRRLTASTTIAGLGLCLAVAAAVDWIPSTAEVEGNPWPIGTCAAIAVIATITTCSRRDARLLRWVPAATLGSAIASWTAVPETSVVLVVGAFVAAFVALTLVGGVPCSSGANVTLAVAVGTVAVWSSSHEDIRRAGAAACLGLLLWWPAGRGLRWISRHRTGLEPGWWLLVAHTGLAFAAARWVGSAQDATWGRLVVIAVLGVLTSAVVRPSATMES